MDYRRFEKTIVARFDRGEEITEEVLEANANVIFDEAENRLHTQKAIMALTMAD